ncbi:MAG: GDYXXLXY domain-containing protein [Bdellovibrionales bacterium]|nr:GDYXXLXY domain-containing protein [Bdellovibrionales bacterium]
MKAVQRNLFVAAIVIQLCSLGYVGFLAWYPRARGVEVVVELQGRDPRSMFRGNYVALQYPFSRLSRVRFTEEESSRIRNGVPVYVRLERKGDVHQMRDVSLSAPQKGLFLRGLVDSPSWMLRGGDIVVSYGIEAYFASPTRARELEGKLFASVEESERVRYARISIAPDGRAALLGLIE